MCPGASAEKDLAGGAHACVTPSREQVSVPSLVPIAKPAPVSVVTEPSAGPPSSVRAGATVSAVQALATVPTLPATSVAVSVKVWLPWPSRS